MNQNQLIQYIKNNLLKIIVKPNSSKNEILGYDDLKKGIKVNIKAPADKNKANVEVVKFFSKLLKKEVKIKSGLTSKEKILKIVFSK
ncbi:YggU family protein [Candidatus Woesearchaeota archaeon]|jgi:uncharacterized protein (TIGR00251 family)|nr:YggU family protein [Candidatus Woesearchaeota archaeon]MBT5271749.1 YggU family protein [Candidatus Woesearchaeota archaeon]MBT6041572.1 YggU family protein [Candidatus Woesearchaeota archaeon]MBT6337387.1 YggU family protein [Candidatus Woesearchaeota archaeon]MBT7927283.1 YggU family protein [Candidatus Woesearchaeota archaeon]